MREAFSITKHNIYTSIFDRTEGQMDSLSHPKMVDRNLVDHESEVVEVNFIQGELVRS